MRIRGIVRVTHVVDVVAFHQEDFVFHLLVSKRMPLCGVCFVTIYTFEFDCLTIEIIGFILDIDLSKTKVR